MTEVLSISAQPGGSSHFAPGGLRRSPSSSSFLLQNASSYAKSSPNLNSAYGSIIYDNRVSASLPSSAPSSPRLAHPDFSDQPSYTSTPSSSLSLDDQCESEEDDIIFPSYADGDYFVGHKGAESPLEQQDPPADTKNSSTASTSPKKISNPFSYADISDPPPPTAGDDTAVKREPSRHVDYLSHNWKEEDIWSSWRHIVGKRKVYGNCSRLENASWRTWAKSKYSLRTVSPDTLNWMKDHDVTWLYGPLQSGTTKVLEPEDVPAQSQVSRSDSFTTKKPILKKRSLSEVMLQRSISSSTLMKQATDALRAQQPQEKIRDRPILDGRTVSDFVTSSHPIRPDTTTDSLPATALPSASTSGLQTPSERRHIHFNDKVEQCIAINKDGDADYCTAFHEDDDSDDGIIMMKPVFGKQRKLSNRTTPRNSFSSESKTIAMLPSTTLKYRGDTPEPAEQQLAQNGGFWGGGAKIPHSPSQETLKPSKPSSNFLLDDEDDEVDMTWQPASSSMGRKANTFAQQARTSETSLLETKDEHENNGLRRTPSGMFMPYEEDEDDIVAAGLFGKVIDTVNTAKDIAHVIWNVGWRR